jgi:hypothetical protein
MTFPFLKERFHEFQVFGLRNFLPLQPARDVPQRQHRPHTSGEISTQISSLRFITFNCVF